jgi:hypothetical protein
VEFLLIPLFILILAAFAVTANEVGVDSRDEFDDPRRSPYPTGIR